MSLKIIVMKVPKLSMWNCRIAYQRKKSCILNPPAEWGYCYRSTLHSAVLHLLPFHWLVGALWWHLDAPYASSSGVIKVEILGGGWILFVWTHISASTMPPAVQCTLLSTQDAHWSTDNLGVRIAYSVGSTDADSSYVVPNRSFSLNGPHIVVCTTIFFRF